jgi:hypothetical protein
MSVGEVDLVDDDGGIEVQRLGLPAEKYIYQE